MPIMYSLTQKKSNISSKCQDGMWYAIAQHNGIVTTENFIKGVCKRFRSLDEGMVMSVLYAVSQHLHEEMLSGHRVELEPLGEFYPVINGTGSTDVKKFEKRNIKDVKVNWLSGKLFSDLRKKATFRLATTRKEQREEKKRLRQRRINEISTK